MFQGTKAYILLFIDYKVAVNCLHIISIVKKKEKLKPGP